MEALLIGLYIALLYILWKNEKHDDIYCMGGEKVNEEMEFLNFKLGSKISKIDTMYAVFFMTCGDLMEI